MIKEALKVLLTISCCIFTLLFFLDIRGGRGMVASAVIAAGCILILLSVLVIVQFGLRHIRNKDLAFFSGLGAAMITTTIFLSTVNHSLNVLELSNEVVSELDAGLCQDQLRVAQALNWKLKIELECLFYGQIDTPMSLVSMSLQPKLPKVKLDPISQMIVVSGSPSPPSLEKNRCLEKINELALICPEVKFLVKGY